MVLAGMVTVSVMIFVGGGAVAAPGFLLHVAIFVISKLGICSSLSVFVPLSALPASLQHTASHVRPDTYSIMLIISAI